ncbi:Integrase core domain [Moellerella wisconsensis]|nr:Integrase core domain [Moellerella wisconsensis]
MDLYSRKIISWAFSDTPNSELTTRALCLAVNKRQPKGEVVFHSDQGGQYTSDAFQRCMKEHNVVSSMSRRRNCLDNAVIKHVIRQLLILSITSNRFIIKNDKIHSLFQEYDNDELIALIVLSSSLYP